MDINIWVDLSSLWPAGSVCSPAGVGGETAGRMEQQSGRTEDDRECGERENVQNVALN